MARRLIVVSHACVLAVNRVAYAHLARMGWLVLVVAPETLATEGRTLQCDPAGPDEPPVRFLQLLGHNPRTYRFRGLRRLIRAEHPDWVVLDNDPHSVLSVELALLRRSVGFRLAFLTCENLPFGPLSLLRRRGIRGFGTSLFLALCRWIVRPRCDLILSINSAGVKLFRAAGFQRVVQTPLGFPEELFKLDPAVRERVRQERGLSGAVVAYFGRLAPEKGPHLLIEALAGLLDREWTLLLDQFMPVDRYQETLLDRLVQSGVRSRVRFIEARHGEVASLMKAADVVILPSVSSRRWVEQYGRVAPEAMACGCLVIAAASGALSELVASSGILLPEGDVDALRSALREWLDDPCRYRGLADQGAQRAREELSARAQAELWNQVLQETSVGGARSEPECEGIDGR